MRRPAHPSRAGAAEADRVSQDFAVAWQRADVTDVSKQLEDLQREVRVLRDRSDILDCINSYGRGLDRLDAGLIRDAYHPDAVDNHGPFVGGVDAFVPFAIDIEASFPVTHDGITSHNCEITGHTAHAESYVQRCADSVQEAGGTMLLQLWHEGGVRNPADGLTRSPSGYGRPETYRRDDGFGGDDIRDRVRFPARLVAAIRRECGPGFLISFRFSQWKESHLRRMRPPGAFGFQNGATTIEAWPAGPAS